MYAALVLVCGLNVPTAVEGCGLSYGPMPFRTQEECVNTLRLLGIPQITASLPPGAFIADAQCVPLSHSA